MTPLRITVSLWLGFLAGLAAATGYVILVPPFAPKVVDAVLMVGSFVVVASPVSWLGIRVRPTAAMASDPSSLDERTRAFETVA